MIWYDMMNDRIIFFCDVGITEDGVMWWCDIIRYVWYYTCDRIWYATMDITFQGLVDMCYGCYAYVRYCVIWLRRSCFLFHDEIHKRADGDHRLGNTIEKRLLVVCLIVCCFTLFRNLPAVRSASLSSRLFFRQVLFSVSFLFFFLWYVC